MSWRLAADTGGTFTDCLALGPGGERRRCKVLSSGRLRVHCRQVSEEGHWIRVEPLPPADGDFWPGWWIQPSGGEGTAIQVTATEQGGFRLATPLTAAPGDLLDLTTGEEAPVIGARLLLGVPPGRAFPPLEMRLATTRATNALLERKGAPTALWLNRGFRDLLRIGDQRRSDLFALHPKPRRVWVQETLESGARLSAEGEELDPPDEQEVRRQAREMLALGIRHAAVALLHSIWNERHERLIGGWLKEEGFEHVSLSCEIAPFPKWLSRAQSTVANATLTAPVRAFVEGVEGPMSGPEGVPMQMMTSAGGLEPCARVAPKDLLLSGPAGGAIGAAAVAELCGIARVLTLDMGGTSTDVARIEGRPAYRFMQRVGGMELMAPSVSIETVAAGGGSICAWTSLGLQVGPESAGADPGPACYGKGGPLTVTDVNLLLGRFDPERAPIPISVEPARKRLAELLEEVERQSGERLSEVELLHSLLGLAVEHMADAIRRISIAEGYDPSDFCLLAFGGAGPQHACEVAERLGMDQVLVPGDAGILSAAGLHAAQPERFAERSLHRPLPEVIHELPSLLKTLRQEAWEDLQRDGHRDETGCEEPAVVVELRMTGQEIPIQVPMPSDPSKLVSSYRGAYQRQFGYLPSEEGEIECVSLRLSLRVRSNPPPEEGSIPGERSRTEAGDQVRVEQDAFCTLVVLPGWSVERLPTGDRLLHRNRQPSGQGDARPVVLQRELLRHRLHSVVENMGALLERTALSTNIRERLDFSCALLDAEGRLISSAPHIPVHLGALGVCVREVLQRVEMTEGDTVITNHPAFGGSHLPDVTLITPVHNPAGRRIGFVANRAHHAEIGGITPGSMPATATCLEEEGVVIEPQFLIHGRVSRFEEIRELLSSAPHPSRRIGDNLADLHAQLAANLQGVERVQALYREFPDYEAGVAGILAHSAEVMQTRLRSLPQQIQASEMLDGGDEIHLSAARSGDKWCLDFTGTSAPNPFNLNATPAIVNSALLYVLRVWAGEDLPLNEGLLRDVEVHLPESFLSPPFGGDSATDPAVVGGNVEVSQRLVDTLFKALEIQACSQGTMNNLLFGNAGFGYYETIGGGGGASRSQAGASGVHTHMTNTAITDPEILERRYPVRLRQFALRHGSGGSGWHSGGDGLIRELEFLQPLQVSVLTQHRRSGPYGIDGGQPGKPGRQRLIRSNGGTEELPSAASFQVEPGWRLCMETPGGGGWGSPQSSA